MEEQRRFNVETHAGVRLGTVAADASDGEIQAVVQQVTGNKSHVVVTGRLEQDRVILVGFRDDREYARAAFGRGVGMRSCTFEGTTLIRLKVTMRTVARNIGRFDALVELGLTSIPNEQLPPEIGTLKLLEDLEICGCDLLAELPSSIGDLCSLETLSISSCSRLQLPAEIGNLAALLKFDCCMCASIQQLPASIGKLTNLKRLSVSSCPLTTFPDTLGQLRDLEVLDCYGCSSLICFPDTLGGLSRLRCLECDMCSSLVSLPDTLGQLKQLKKLDCRWTPLTKLPASIVQLHDLNLMCDPRLALTALEPTPCCSCFYSCLIL
jgi:hypothetical protein